MQERTPIHLLFSKYVAIVFICMFSFPTINLSLVGVYIPIYKQRNTGKHDLSKGSGPIPEWAWNKHSVLIFLDGVKIVICLLLCSQSCQIACTLLSWLSWHLIYLCLRHLIAIDEHSSQSKGQSGTKHCLFQSLLNTFFQYENYSFFLYSNLQKFLIASH